MRAGKRNRRITIERYAETQDAMGQVVETWSTHAIRWANVRPNTGSESVQDGKLTAKQSLVLNMRYTDITTKDRIVMSSRVFNILSVNNLHERNKEVEVAVVEHV